jgi:enoyl-CoA hydratase/carnithine racemase
MGLVDYLVPEGEFESKVKEVTQNCLKIASEGQRQTKRLLAMAFDLNLERFYRGIYGQSGENAGLGRTLRGHGSLSRNA